MNETQLLLTSVAQAWPDDELPPGPVAEALESDLVIALRQLDVASESGEGAAAARNAVWSVIQRSPDLHDRLQVEYDALLLDLERGPDALPPDLPGAIRRDRCLAIPVLYATDRKAHANGRNESREGASKEPAVRFSGERGDDLAFGTATVSIPDDHRLGALEKPRRWRLQFRADPARHVLVDDLKPLSRGDFAAVLQSGVQEAKVPDVLVFVHGYNVGFDDAARRAAQLAYDLNFEGVPLLYSWPSEGRVTSYLIDEGNARWTLPHFTDFLGLLGGQVTGVVHLIAHSMGNRVLTEALGNFSGASPAARLGHVVFAAPDVDASVFTSLARSFVPGAGRYTLYASSKDQALKASRRLARYPRAGQSGKGIVVVAGVDTIDATGLDTGLMSHSYFGDHTSIVSDIYALVRHGHPPDQRFGLRRARHASGVYWTFAARRS